MIVNPEALASINAQFKKAWNEAFNAVKTNHEEFTMVIPSTSASNDYGWVGSLADIREWIGDRVINDLSVHTYSIKNKDFELSHGVKRTDIEDDNLGIAQVIFKGHGKKFGEFPGKMSWNILKDGFAHVCYDGQYYFDTDHPVYPNSDGTGVAETVSNIQSGAGASPLWVLLDLSQMLLPVVWQDRKKPVFTSMTKLDDEHVFTTNNFRWGTDSRGNSGLTLWQLAYASKEPLTRENADANILAMEAFKADGGEKLGVTVTHCLVSPENYNAAVEVFENEYIDSVAKTKNPYHGRIKVIKSPTW